MCIRRRVETAVAADRIARVASRLRLGRRESVLVERHSDQILDAGADLDRICSAESSREWVAWTERSRRRGLFGERMTKSGAGVSIEKWALQEPNTPSETSEKPLSEEAGAVKSAATAAGDLAAAIVEVASLPLSAAEKATVIRRLLAGWK